VGFSEICMWVSVKEVRENMRCVKEGGEGGRKGGGGDGGEGEGRRGGRYVGGVVGGKR